MSTTYQDLARFDESKLANLSKRMEETAVDTYFKNNYNITLAEVLAVIRKHEPELLL